MTEFCTSSYRQERKRAAEPMFLGRRFFLPEIRTSLKGIDIATSCIVAVIPSESKELPTHVRLLLPGYISNDILPYLIE